MPRPDPSSFLPLTRRDVFLAVGAGALSLMLPGCGGGGHGGGGAAAKPVTVAGTVEPGSLASSSGLTVTNVYQASAPVGAAGEFSTLASSSGTMVHFVTNASGDLVAAALSTPGQVFTFNAESTLQAALFMTPGVGTPQTQTATNVIAGLKGQASYANALAYVQAKLPTTPFQDLLADATFSSLLIQCVLDFSPPSAKSRAIYTNPTNGNDTTNKLAIQFDQDHLSSTAVNVANTGWRFVRINRLERDPGNVVTGATVPVTNFGFNFATGAEPTDLGGLLVSLVFGDEGEGRSVKDAHSLNLSTVSQTDYWVQGPGFAKGETLPNDEDDKGNLYVPDDRGYVTVLSLFRYVFWPLAEAILGSEFKPKSDVGQWVKKLYEVYEASSDALAVLETLFQPGSGSLAGDVEIVADKIIEAVRTLLIRILESGVFEDLGDDVAKEFASGLASFLGRYKFVFVAVNIGKMVAEWISYEPTFRLTIFSDGTGGVTVQ